MRVYHLIFTACLALYQTASATEIDLTPEIVKNKTQLYQSQSGWCSSYAASNLMTFKLKKPISPFDFVSEYIGLKKEANHGANIIELISVLKSKSKYCLESNYSNISLKEFESLFASGDYDRLKDEKGFEKPDSIDLSKHESLLNKLSMYNNVSMTRIKEKIFEKKSYFDFILEMNNENCVSSINSSTFKTTEKSISDFSPEGIEENIKFINHILIDKKVPLYASIDSQGYYYNKNLKKESFKVLMNSDEYNQLSLLEKIKFNVNGMVKNNLKTDHALLITGLKKMNSKNYFRILDSNYASRGQENCQKDFKDSILSDSIICDDEHTYLVEENTLVLLIGYLLVVE